MRSDSPRRFARSDNGESLVEVLISILIIAIVFVAIMAGFGTSIGISVIHKQQATAQTIARDFSEYLQYNAAVGYDSSCPASYAFAVTSFQDYYRLPDGSQPLKGASASYSVQVDQVDYMTYVAATNQATFGPACTPTAGAQRITFHVTSLKDPSITQSLQVVKRAAT